MLQLGTEKFSTRVRNRTVSVCTRKRETYIVAGYVLVLEKNSTATGKLRQRRNRKRTFSRHVVTQPPRCTRLVYEALVN